MKRLAALTILLATSSASMAIANELDDAIIKFIDASGFERVDAMALETGLEPVWLRHDLVSPGGAVGPLEKAVMIASGAIPSVRTRTAISYAELLHDEGNGAPYPVSFIEVRHYNLAALIREDAIESYGAENVAELEEFGFGEHIAWRFAFSPMMNNAAVLLEASTRTISEAEAGADDCTGRPCLDLYASFDEVGDWEEMAGALPDWPLLYSDRSDEVATPEFAIAQLAVLGFWANAESGDYQWTGGEHPEAARGIQPYRFIGIDRHLGQDASIDTLWHETLLNDDAIAELYFRRAEVAGQVYLMRASVARPGY